ncbi:MAG: glycoside hydrolase family 3 N-terminal domain-containing protein, partial [Acholeplasma sp.]|nr:glycoside hydrolase family 3 N-terminal domain-containing protein [Acholeplasma sp.]
KPKVQLIAFSKTKLLKPLEHQDVKLVFAIEKMGSYDDFGYISKSSYVLEAGDYTIYYGNSARSISKALVYKNKENIVTERLEEALAPVKKFKRIKPKFKGGKYVLSYENVPLRTVDLANRITSNLPEQLPLNNEKIVFDDVKAGKVSLDQFIGSLSVIELSDLLIAEGMSSPKVTPGTAGAIGGTTDELQSKKVDILCCSDGPSGIRMDSGGLATSLPNGTLLASTFNPDIIERLYQFLGMEMNNYNVNIILGPGMNIQRHPLNGRNFEYFSEDPLLTGMMASAAIRGLNKVGVDGSLKHFAANNQETARTMANSIISERALREIYLKGFEIAVKESKAAIVMTAYNPINGIWTASNYDLTTTILRKEWGFDGVVMTDWWAQMNIDNDEPSKENTMAMVRAQNDLYMVVPNVREHKHNLVTEYQKGNITLGEIQRTAKNVLKLIIKMSNRSGKDFNNQINKWFETNSIFSMEEYFNDGVAKKFITDYEELANETIIKHFNFFDKKDQVVYGVVEKDSQVLYTFGVKPLVIKNEFDEIFKEITSHNLYTFKKENWGLVTLDLNGYVYKNKQANDEWDNVPKDAIYVYEVDCLEDARYIIEIELSSKLPNENQMPFSIYVDNINEQTLTTNGTNDEKITVRSYIVINKGKHYLSFKFHKTGITVHNIKVIKHG